MSFEGYQTLRIGNVHRDALSSLTQNYGKVLLTVFLVMVLMFAATLVFMPLILGFQFVSVFSIGYGYSVIDNGAEFLAIFIPIWLGCMAISILLQSVTEPLRAGQRLCMLTVIERRLFSVGNLFHPFKRFFRFAGCFLWITLWTFLWSLLLIVPGIIKFLSYSMTPYLVLQYDNITIREAMDLSKRITQGYKGQIFLMHLIMFAWSLVMVVPIILIVLFPLSPLFPLLLLGFELLAYVYVFLWYMPLYAVLDATLYSRIKAIAFARGTLTADDLKIFVN